MASGQDLGVDDIFIHATAASIDYLRRSHTGSAGRGAFCSIYRHAEARTAQQRPRNAGEKDHAFIWTSVNRGRGRRVALLRSRSTA